MPTSGKTSKSLIAILLVCLSISLVTMHQTVTEAQKTINNRSAVVHYSIFAKSNYTATTNITFVWYLRQTEWSKVDMLSSQPTISGSGYMNCEGDSVDKDDFVAFQGFGWRFGAAAPDEVLHIDFRIKATVSAFSPSMLLAESVGTIDDVSASFSTKELARYLDESYYWDYHSHEVQAVISQIQARSGGSRNVFEVVRSTLMWFTEHTMYSYPYEFDYPTGRVRASQILNQSFLDRHYGICRHYVDLFIAIMRGFGVPCLMEEGLLLVDNEGELDVLGRHAWAVVYFLEVGWQRVDVTVPDRSTFDIVGVGLAPYPFYYVPEYIEYANVLPDPVEGTVYPYTIIGGSIEVEREESSLSLTGDSLILYGFLAITVLLAVLVITTRMKIAALEKRLAGGVGSMPAEGVPTFCTACGAPRPRAARFCTRCGNRFT